MTDGEWKSGITDNEIMAILTDWRWEGYNAKQGRLMLLELISKAGAGYYNSHTEEGFLNAMKVLKSDRTPNKKGRIFICEMVYKHSNLKSPVYELIGKYRCDNE